MNRNQLKKEKQIKEKTTFSKTKTDWCCKLIGSGEGST